MMRSMTGYGQGNWQGKGCKITVEVRSVNQRFLEARFNLPREYVPWEAALRLLLQEVVARGKVDVNVTRSGATDSAFAVEVNTRLARAYVDGWRQLQKALRLDGRIDLQFLLGRPDLVRVVERRTEAAGELAHVRQVLRQALRAFNREREREGRALARDMRQRLGHLDGLLRQMQARVVAAAPDLAARLRQRVQTLAAGVAVSEDRLAQEIALLASRGDVTEELVRLASHLDAMRGVLSGREPAGKRLDFLLQEIHREVNTIASKSNDLGITNVTLEARGEIEKLREQAQNVE
jgi:uncharacterized protein (TIGR00255 family)